MRLGACLAGAALALAAPAAVRAEEGITRELRPDGAELLVLSVPGARTVSLRYVVRAGSAQDPPAKEGLAHLLEHMVLRRRASNGLDAMEAAHAAGANLNGYTSRDATVYALDAPAATFPQIAERVLRAVTSPQFSQADLDQEIEVVGRESEYHGDDGGVIQLISDTLFRVGPPTGILGTGLSLGKITPDDLTAFYRSAYSTASTTIVVAGATTAEEVRTLLGRAMLLPPTLEGERTTAPAFEPLLPVNERLRAPFIAVVLGYRLDPADRERCRPVAELLERRLSMQLMVEDPQLNAVSVHCLTLQGVDFILALGYTPTIDSTEVPAALQRVFSEVARRPLEARERKSIEQRMSREDDRILADPVAWADRAAGAAARPRTAGTTTLPDLGFHAFPEREVREVARSRFLPQRRVLIVLSPFEG